MSQSNTQAHLKEFNQEMEALSELQHNNIACLKVKQLSPDCIYGKNKGTAFIESFKKCLAVQSKHFSDLRATVMLFSHKISIFIYHILILQSARTATRCWA